MTTHTTPARWLAIAAGAASTIGGLTILLGPSLMNPREWEAYHWLTMLMIFGTIAFGHLSFEACRAKSFSALGFAALFLVGTGLIVYNSVGRQSAVTDAKAMTAEQTNTAIAAKAVELDDAKKRLVKAHRKVELQINGGVDDETGEKVKKGCFDVCNGWKQQRSDIAIVVKNLEQELRELGPKKPVNATAERFADIAALFHFDKAKSVAAFTLIEPFLWTLFFEFGSIISLGYAFRPASAAPVKAPSKIDSLDLTFADADLNRAELPSPDMFAGELPEPTPPKPGKRLPTNIIPFANHPARVALENAGGEVWSNRELASLQGVCDGEGTKRVDELVAAGIAERQKIGKKVRIRLTA